MNYDIIVIGENGLDIFEYGRVERISPEAPVPIFNPENIITNPGMAGNVVKNLESLSPTLKIHFFSHINQIEKKRYIDIQSGYILLRVDTNDYVKESFKFDYNIFLKLVEKCTCLKSIVISDYCKGFLTEEDIKNILTWSNSHKILTFMDTKKILGSWSELATFVKINMKEYQTNNIINQKTTKNYCKNLIVTDGSAGSMYFSQLGVQYCLLEKIVEIKDVSGAGDTYLAAFVIKYLECNNINEAMKYANKAATIAVSKQGVVTVTNNDINELFEN